MKIKSWMSGLKSHNLLRFLRSVAWDLDLKVEIIERDKGWIRETIYFELDGEIENLERFNQVMKETANKYNKGK